MVLVPLKSGMKDNTKRWENQGKAGCLAMCCKGTSERSLNGLSLLLLTKFAAEKILLSINCN